MGDASAEGAFRTVKRLRDLFVESDVDQNGVLDPEELAKIIRTFYRDNQKSRSMKQVKAEVDASLEKFDKDGNGVLDFAEFMELVVADDTCFKFHMAPEEMDQVRQISHQVFRRRDHQAEGAKVDKEGLPLRPSASDFEILYLKYDLDRSGRIDAPLEAKQLVTNLVVTLSLDVEVDEIEAMVAMQGDWDYGMDQSEFTEWFYRTLLFSLHAVDN